jgi:hypothetical protein
MYSRCAATAAARAGQALISIRNVGEASRGGAGREVDGLREPGQPRCGGRDCQRVAGRGAVAP